MNKLISKLSPIVFLIPVCLFGCGAREDDAGIASGATTGKPNLVIIMADQLRYQSLGYAGDDKAMTPNIDRLESQGLNFQNFVASTPVCSATRASLLTGKYASTTGVVINELRLNPNQDTYAHVLNQSGYSSALIGKWHLWANDTMHEKTANQFVPVGPYRMGFDGYWAGFNFWHKNNEAFYFEDSATPELIQGDGSEKLATLAIEQIRKSVAAGQPFNILLALSEPHDPWEESNVPARWYDKFEGVDFELPSTWKTEPDPRMDRNTDPVAWREHWTPNLPEYMRVYYAMTANLDEQVGRVLAALDDAGVADNTIVVFMSDHGEMFGAQGRVFKMIFYEESARVPFLIRWPGRIPAGLISDAPMSTPDIMPTLLGLMEQPVPVQVEGVDLSHIALGKAGPVPEFAFLQGMGHTFLWEDGFEWRALRNKRFTYARYLSDGKELLFDNIDDPRQQHDLAQSPQHEKKLIELREKMNRRMIELNDDFLSVSDYREKWTENRVILRAAKGGFHRQLGQDVEVDIDLRSASDVSVFAAHAQ